MLYIASGLREPRPCPGKSSDTAVYCECEAREHSVVSRQGRGPDSTDGYCERDSSNKSKARHPSHHLMSGVRWGASQECRNQPISTPTFPRICSSSRTLADQAGYIFEVARYIFDR